ncbi:Ku protein [Streptomyces sp. P1-3]|uniref:Ku protein n=1 Tax=Streptomyces sp. P1-3 TaxID=3421658 RepID=UPI003D36CF65
MLGGALGAPPGSPEGTPGIPQAIPGAVEAPLGGVLLLPCLLELVGQFGGSVPGLLQLLYGLLRDALQESGSTGIATMAMRQREYLVAVHAEGGIIAMNMLHWADEVRDPHQLLDNLPGTAKGDARERKMAQQLIEAMAMDWDPTDYTDRTQERVRALVEAKQSGQPLEKAEAPPESTSVVDLMSVLQASVEKAHKGRGKKEPKAAGGGSRPTARKASRPAKEDLAALTKAELYQRAADADIPGRSTMTRDELLQALKQTRRTRAKRKAS